MTSTVSDGGSKARKAMEDVREGCILPHYMGSPMSSPAYQSLSVLGQCWVSQGTKEDESLGPGAARSCPELLCSWSSHTQRQGDTRQHFRQPGRESPRQMCSACPCNSIPCCYAQVRQGEQTVAEMPGGVPVTLTLWRQHLQTIPNS